MQTVGAKASCLQASACVNAVRRRLRTAVVLPHLLSAIGSYDTGRLAGTYPADALPLSESPTIHPKLASWHFSGSGVSWPSGSRASNSDFNKGAPQSCRHGDLISPMPLVANEVDYGRLCRWTLAKTSGPYPYPE